MEALPRASIAFNGGGGNTKAVVNGQEVILPSYVLFGNTEFFKEGGDCKLASDATEYLSGSNAALICKTWSAGKSAVSRARVNGSSSVRIQKTESELSNAKIKEAFPLFFESLYQSGKLQSGINNVAVFCTHQNALGTGMQLKDELCGVHFVRRNGVDFILCVAIPKDWIANEGSHLHNNFPFGILDLGELTAMLTVLNEGGVTIGQYPMPFGVHKLKEAIAESPETSRMFDVSLSVDDVALALNRTSKRYKALPLDADFELEVKKKNLGTIYKKEVKKWLKDTLNKAIDIADRLNELGSIDADQTVFYAIGGGTLLPFVDTMLTQSGIELYGGDALMADISTTWFAQKDNLASINDFPSPQKPVETKTRKPRTKKEKVEKIESAPAPPPDPKPLDSDTEGETVTVDVKSEVLTNG